MSNPSKTPTVKLFRRPLPPKALPPISDPVGRSLMKSDEYVSHTKRSDISSGDSAFYKHSISDVPDMQPYSPVPSWVQSIVSPPPPSESAPTHQTFNTGANFGSPVNTVMSRITRDEMKFILDPLYRGRTALGTYVDGKALIKPFRPRGPESFPLRNLPPNPDLVHYFDTDDMRYYIPPAFTLEHFLYKLSKNNRIPMHVAKQAVYSRENYKKFTKLLAENLMAERGVQNEVHKVHMDPKVLPPAEPRIPQHQLLIEMASMIKTHVRELLNTDVRSVIKPMPKYSPSYRDETAPHTEIILYEDDRAERLTFETKSRQSSELPGKDAVVQAPKTYFQGSERSASPFTCPSEEVISPCELAILDSLANGGTVLSLKAHFICELPDITPLLNTLVYLNISFNDFQILPPEIMHIEHLEVLKLRNNPLKELPDDIGRLKNLRHLVVSFCLLSSFPPSLFDLEKLEFLDLSYNRIASIPNAIRRLKNLWSLKLEGNQLPAMSSGCTHLRLQHLNVQNNFMNPLFWTENTRKKPQRLVDIAALTIYNMKLHEVIPDQIPEAVHKIMDSRDVCECCRGALFGPGLKIIRPAAKMFGIKCLPFMFRACSPSCLKVFQNSTDSLYDMLYGD
ncbi:uncharacterized protein LOC121372602 [Gigantopelta aegis]|uniref:uncharacterized protein LOC121372602 n=1 Tax=Gigantopelta aegis TaxID=1735272 RepID=UPI001B88AB67|nr:uncharacterized protein LOC121372602 [Gigantopelta aegis]XP_041354961.1 uncharacterized protein LOC121372602 [Gigantopelta aegis]XP_041354969.1 uncharacterized protein LOC121372602 [Gigantopelta aegis]